MKVVYKKPILERLKDALKQAEDEGVQINYIELSKDEISELKRWIKLNGKVPEEFATFQFNGVPIKEAE